MRSAHTHLAWKTERGSSVKGKSHQLFKLKHKVSLQLMLLWEKEITVELAHVQSFKLDLLDHT